MNKRMMKCFIVLIYVMLLACPNSVISDCWDIQEISSFAFKELDGATVLSFKDAVRCMPLSEVTVEIKNQTFTTDSNGYIVFPNKNIASIMDGSLQMTAKKNGYCTLTKDIRVMVGRIKDKRYLMTKRLPIGKARFVLQWGDKPRDLDLHLVGEDFHISYRNMKVAVQKARLDRDDVSSYGPETITLENIISSKKYDVYVHNYSGESSINDLAQVSVYKNGKLDNIVILPQTKKPYVKILEIRNHEVKYLNIGLNGIP